MERIISDNEVIAKRIFIKNTGADIEFVKNLELISLISSREIWFKINIGWRKNLYTIFIKFLVERHRYNIEITTFKSEGIWIYNSELNTSLENSFSKYKISNITFSHVYHEQNTFEKYLITRNSNMSQLVKR